MDLRTDGGVLVAFGTALAFCVFAAALVLGYAWIAGGTARVAPPALLGLWVPLVSREAPLHGVPPILELGLIAHESGGDYLAAHADANGTEDAGLGQVNSIHWGAYGLRADPFAPRRNVAASLDLLAAALAAHPGDVATALEAYNGFGVGYAQAVLAAVADLAAGPELDAWPVGGRHVGTGGRWAVAPSAGPAEAYVLVTAYAPVGKPLTGTGGPWPTLAAPVRLTAVQDGADLNLEAAAQAPPGLMRLTPPHAAFWWAVARLPAHGTARITVTARWGEGTSSTGVPRATRLVRSIRLQAG